MPVEIIAHRGASRDCLENTLQAFQRALDQGADAFELDVHATTDGIVVVHHDPDIAIYEPAQPSATGHSIAGDNVSDGTEGHNRATAVRRLTINAVDYTALRDVRLKNGEGVPTLDEVLALARGRATVYVEVKGLGIETEVVDCLLRHPETRTAVHSFDHRIPSSIGHRIAGYPTGILSASYVLDFPRMIQSAKARDLWQHTALIDQELIDTTHTSGARVVAWTENSVEHAVHLVQMGVDAICTDIPAVIRSGLEDAGLLRRR